MNIDEINDEYVTGTWDGTDKTRFWIPRAEYSLWQAILEQDEYQYKNIQLC